MFKHFAVGPVTRMIGLVRGHWGLPANERNMFGSTRIKFREDSARSDRRDKDLGDNVNYGIASVVPAWKIREVLDHPELVAYRQAAIRRSHQQAGAAETPDQPTP